MKNTNKMKNEISMEKMCRITAIQVMGKITGNPYYFENLAKLSYDELTALHEIERKSYNAFTAKRTFDKTGKQTN